MTDQRLFLLDDAAWAEFIAILDAPSRPMPRLDELLADESIFDATDSETTASER